jgi:glutathione synthase
MGKYGRIVQHLFLIDPLDQLNLQLDSSLRMARALEALGHRCYFATTDNLRQESDGQPMASTFRINWDGGENIGAKEQSTKCVSDFACVHMRKDPPFDINYIATTWLLDHLPKSTLVVNRPDALRGLNEKAAIFRLGNLAKPALLTANADTVFKFAEKIGAQELVVKPLYLWGGRGVERLSLSKDAQKIRDSVNGSELKIVQEFNPKVAEGEVRAFTVDCQPIAWCLKKPAAGEFLANTRNGATLLTYKPKPSEIATVVKAAEILRPFGAYIIGFDLIDGFVSEVNITSPRILAGSASEEQAIYARFAELIVTLVKQHTQP